MIWLVEDAASIPQMTNVVPGRGCGRQLRLEMRVFVGDIKAVQIIKKREAIASVGEQWFPFGPIAIGDVGVDGLDQNDFRAMALEVEARQHVGFGTFDVDFQHVDTVAEIGFVDKARQAFDLALLGAVAGTVLLGAVGVGFDGAGQAMQSIDDVEIDAAIVAASQTGHDLIARTNAGVGRRKAELRFDDQSAPALEVEVKRDVVGDGVAAADVDVCAVPDVGEDQVEVIVFEVLGVGQVHRRSRCALRLRYVLPPRRFTGRQGSLYERAGGHDASRNHQGAQAVIIKGNSHVSIPPILTSAAELLGRYDVLLCDLWGVVHDGRKAYPGANDALPRFRATGGTVVMVSNAPMTAPAVAQLLADKGVRRETWDAIVASGDLALRHIAERGYTRVYGIGPRIRDASFFDAVATLVDQIDAADAIACTGLVDDCRETAADYVPILQQALLRQLPFVCANPDLAVHVGKDLLPCAGAIATLYEAMGGTVFWGGKPHPVAYDTGLAIAAKLREGAIDKRRVLGIGDALRTDVKAAANADVDALFIAGGLHRDDMIVDGRIDSQRLAADLAANAAVPVAVMRELVW